MIADSAATGFLLLAIGLGVYFVPTIVAVYRGVTSQGSVFVINLFLGWTLIGWVVALAMAARSKPTTTGSSPATPPSHGQS